jgi:hypothetical protein
MLSRALWIDVREEIGDFNYLLELNRIDSARRRLCQRNNLNTFIPIGSIGLDSDKRKLEKVFNKFDVKRPITCVVEDVDSLAAEKFCAYSTSNSSQGVLRGCLKSPPTLPSPPTPLSCRFFTSRGNPRIKTTLPSLGAARARLCLPT